MKHILLVCTANICRSPMAMGLVRSRLAQDGLADQVSVSSAGIYGLDGQAASALGVEVLAERGIDISDHRARSISEQDIAQADLILVMEESHRRSLFYMAPHMLGKVFLYSEMAGEHGDIEDPYRRPKEEYERCADELARLLDKGYPRILQRLAISQQR